MRYDFDGWTNTFQEGCNAHNWFPIGNCEKTQVFQITEFHLTLDDEKCCHIRLYILQPKHRHYIINLYGFTRILWHGTLTFPSPTDGMLHVLLQTVSPETHYTGHATIDKVIGSP